MKWRKMQNGLLGAWALLRCAFCQSFSQVSTPGRPRVLYVDTLSAPFAQSNVRGIRKAYEKAGVVEAFDYRRAAVAYGVRLMNMLLVLSARKFCPEIVHLGKCELISGKTIRQIKRDTDAYVLHFYGDYRPEPQPWVIDIGRYADVTYLYHRDHALIEAHRAAGIRRIGYWWVGADPTVFFPRKLEKIYDVVFMANYASNESSETGRDNTERRQLVEALADRDVDVHVFGRGWEALDAHSHIHLHDFVDDEAFAQACSRARITLGMNTARVPYYTSWRRPLNSMACGAFHLTRRFPGLETVFENGKHLVWFDTLEEAVEKARYYLAHDHAREMIASKGRNEVLQQHTWDCRIAWLLKEYQRHKKKGEHYDPSVKDKNSSGHRNPA